MCRPSCNASNEYHSTGPMRSTVVLGVAYHSERRGPHATKALETIEALLSTTGMRSGLRWNERASGS
jgi:hypothetical protein